MASRSFLSLFLVVLSFSGASVFLALKPIDPSPEKQAVVLGANRVLNSIEGAGLSLSREVRHLPASRRNSSGVPDSDQKPVVREPASR